MICIPTNLYGIDMTTIKKRLLASMFLRSAFLAGALALPLASNTANAQTGKLQPVTYLMPAPQNLPDFAPWMLAR